MERVRSGCNIIVLYFPGDQKCTSRGGGCLFTEASSCAVPFTSGLCAGPVNRKCCLSKGKVFHVMAYANCFDVAFAFFNKQASRFVLNSLDNEQQTETLGPLFFKRRRFFMRKNFQWRHDETHCRQPTLVSHNVRSVTNTSRRENPGARSIRPSDFLRWSWEFHWRRQWGDLNVPEVTSSVREKSDFFNSTFYFLSVL